MRMRWRMRNAGVVTSLGLAGVLAVAGLAPAAVAAPGPTGPTGATGATGPTSAGVTAETATGGRLIVRLVGSTDTDADADARLAAVLREVVAAAGGRVVARQPGLGMAVVDGPAGLATVLEAQPWVTGVTRDAAVTLTSLGYDPATQNGSMTKVTQITGASGMWKAGWTGKGIDVAVIDTGVAPVPGLAQADKVVLGPDLSFESQSSATRFLDSYGHGTHMSGIVAGREVPAASGSTYAADTKNFYGMAPDSRIVSLKVGDHNGTVDVSQVIAAVNWVTQFGKTNGLNVRVLNLSFGLDTGQHPKNDPLSWAAEMAWNKGIVVVASGGNQGDTYPGLNSPAYNSRLLAIGAVDTKGTTAITDDTIPGFSAVFGGNFQRGPDLVAPGVGIISSRVPGSVIAETYPTAKVATNWLRGSGTSQAAAVVSGAVALLLQQRPGMTPDQVKALLMNTATSISGISANSQGKGELNLTKATATAVPTTVQPSSPGWGDGGIENARGGMHVTLDGTELSGERYVFGNWQGNDAGYKITNASMWSTDGSTWNGVPLTGTGFTTDTTTAAGKAWNGRSWAGRSWAGTTWTGRSWASCNFTGRSWASTGWTTGTWSQPITTNSWTGNLWSTGDWK
jgi:serine protease AprX